MLPIPPVFTTEAVRQNGTVIVRPHGELDIATAPVLRATINDQVTPGVQTVIVDFAALDFVDIAGLRAVLDAKHAATAHHADFRLRSVKELTELVIRIGHFADLEAAIEPDRQRRPTTAPAGTNGSA
jgi:anti-sigma B factor antagonist